MNKENASPLSGCPRLAIPRVCLVAKGISGGRAISVSSPCGRMERESEREHAAHHGVNLNQVNLKKG